MRYSKKSKYCVNATRQILNSSACALNVTSLRLIYTNANLRVK